MLALWLVLLVLAAPLAGKLTGAEDNQASSWLPGSAESTQVLRLQEQFGTADTATAVVLYTRPSGITPTDHAKAVADAAAFTHAPHVVAPIRGPVASADGRALQTVVPISIGNGGWTNLTPAVNSLRTTATTGDPGLAVHVTGPAGVGADEAKAFSGIDSTLLYATVTVVIVLLLLTYRSPVLWLLPLLSAGCALFAAEAVIYLLAAHAGLTVNAQSAGILIVLVIGAGTDYALLITARYREELRRHEDRHEAMAYALRRAAPAILASAGTVGMGMLCLLVAEMNSTASLGPVCAIGVGVGLLSMLTLLPALLVICGRWVFWPVKPGYGTPEPTATGVWAHVGDRIGHRPRVVWIATALVLGVFALGMVALRADGLSTASSFTGKPESVTGQQVLAQHFPAGSGSPVVVISNAAEAAPVRQALAGTPGIASTTTPVVRNGYAYTEGTLASAPDSKAAQDTVDAVRANIHAVPGAQAKAGGNTAVQLDTQRASQHDNLVVIPLVLSVVLVILGLLLRALVAPLVLIATVVLSYAAALGMSAFAFRHLFHFGGEDSAFPLFVFVFLVALGVDYNIFLMTRVREESRRLGTRAGARAGLAATGGVITSAGLILASTFAVLGTLPVVAFAEIGFAVALGVLLDALVVRSVLVTALTMDLDHRIWWPSALSRAGGPPAQRRERAAPSVTHER
ncbi:MMPL family transporter [Streptacidiphilus jiangxiensis]|uniref:Putative drug exporter of the RND superfamily n=1 Tax=Streptacidiphilus jiangxiensis TaxID=235985 RepID=A0A1H7QUH7_STRJI|nr:MMPL family transporter [Streptacidiphilus jiangxiensis]SEL51378.1 putative drug exporter of the RND superfamily [Streptacidiphilus jiangxiensis]